MRRILSIILIISFSVTFIGPSFANEGDNDKVDSAESPPVKTSGAPGSPASPTSPPATQMNSTGLGEFQRFSGNVIDDHVDLTSGAVVVKQTDLVIPGRNGLDLVISRYYNSRKFSTPPGLLSASQQNFMELFSEVVSEEVARLTLPPKTGPLAIRI